MTFWWLNNLPRANNEREQLAKLAEQADWLKNLSVSLGDGNLEAEFDINIGSELFGLILAYPVVFPDAPPLVKTRSGERISGHQYGASGELCLEYRPDNWRSDVTGAMMIESAYRLLSGEHAQEGADVPEIIDGHAVSVGQETRNALGRFVLTPEDSRGLQGLEENTLYTGMIGERIQDKTSSTRLIRIGEQDSPIWESLSRFVERILKTEIYVVKQPAKPIPISPKIVDVISCIGDAAHGDFKIESKDDDGTFYLLTSEKNRWTLYWASLNKEKPFVYSYSTILDGSQERRLPEEIDLLREFKVGIVGCGSIGSKIATQLARSEVASFLLIDDDIFFEGNLVRTELDVADIGFHKSRALRTKLLTINPKLSIETRQIRLGGQEASESTVSAMEQLSGCNLIIDATADPNAFNIIATVCKKGKIPVVWGSVFAGGIGGIIGRALPDSDPEPLDARQQVSRWCDSQGVEAPKSGNDNNPYEAQNDDGRPEVATDADVSVIAAHVTRLAIDTLVRPGNSIFPNSAYIVGLSPAWIFTAPFDTRPIGYVDQKEWSSDQEPATQEELLEFIKGLLPAEAAGDA